MESFFFGGVIREGKAGIGLDDANRGEKGKIETASDGLGADNDVDFAGFYFVIERIKSFPLFIVSVKTSNSCSFEEFFEFSFKEFCAEAFMNNADRVAFWTGMRDFCIKTARVTEERKRVGVESEREETGWTEGLPAAFFADSERGGAATVVEDEGLAVIFEIFSDSRNEFVAEIAVFGKILSIFEIYDANLWGDGGILRLLCKGDEGIFPSSNIKI